MDAETNMSKQIFVGTFSLGHENVDLYALPEESGGYFYTRPDENSKARIKVGLDHRHWDMAVDVLLHEAFEMATARAGRRYQKCGNITKGSDRYHFIFDHNDFTEICGAVAVFLSAALPKLAVHWTKLHKKK